MEDSLKGILITITLAALFITCILNFIVIFPQEQGVSFSDPSSQQAYLTASSTAANTSIDASSDLEDINNATSSGFNQWDITQGFMGSNTMKQSTGSGIKSYSNNIFTNLLVIAKQVFGEGSPVIYVIGILLTLTTAYLIYATIKFIRTGN